MQSCYLAVNIVLVRHCGITQVNLHRIADAFMQSSLKTLTTSSAEMRVRGRLRVFFGSAFATAVLSRITR
jgi:hypothetical protein